MNIKETNSVNSSKAHHLTHVHAIYGRHINLIKPNQILPITQLTLAAILLQVPKNAPKCLMYNFPNIQVPTIKKRKNILLKIYIFLSVPKQSPPQKLNWNWQLKTQKCEKLLALIVFSTNHAQEIG